jgi:hypothetical protein
MHGVMAHELQEVVPYAVSGIKDAVDADGKIIPQAVDYSKLTPILIKAIQEQDIKIKDQQKQIDEFIKNDSIKDFFINNIDDILSIYQPGKVENKPEVLKQIQEIKENKNQMILRVKSDNKPSQKTVRLY